MLMTKANQERRADTVKMRQLQLKIWSHLLLHPSARCSDTHSSAAKHRGPPLLHQLSNSNLSHSVPALQTAGTCAFPSFVSHVARELGSLSPFPHPLRPLSWDSTNSSLQGLRFWGVGSVSHRLALIRIRCDAGFPRISQDLLVGFAGIP